MLPQERFANDLADLAMRNDNNEEEEEEQQLSDPFEALMEESYEMDQEAGAAHDLEDELYPRLTPPFAGMNPRPLGREEE